MWTHFLALTGVSLNVLASCSTDVFSRFWYGLPFPVKTILLASALGKSWDAVKVDQIIAKITWNLILGSFHAAAHQQRRLQHLLELNSALTFVRHVEDAWFSEKTTTTTALPTQHEFQFNFSAIYRSLWRQLPVDSRRRQCVLMNCR